LKILIASPGVKEIKLLRDKLNFKYFKDKNFSSYSLGKLNVDILVTGYGSVFMTYNLTKIFQVESYDLAINVGLAKSYDYFLEIGYVVNVVQDQFADLGFEYKGNIYSLWDNEMIDLNSYPFIDDVLNNIGDFELEEVERLPKVKAITLNTLYSTFENVEKFREKYNPDIETMEGAAFFFVCLSEQVSFLQIRAISGFADIHNVENWNLPIALENLSDTIFSILNELNVR